MKLHSGTSGSLEKAKLSQAATGRVGDGHRDMERNTQPQNSLHQNPKPRHFVRRKCLVDDMHRSHGISAFPRHQGEGMPTFSRFRRKIPERGAFREGFRECKTAMSFLSG